MDENYIIQCCDLSKRFGELNALKKISLNIKKGEVFGLLGTNGAGKTTLIRCLMNLVSPTAGKIFFKKEVLRASNVQSKFGFLPEAFQPPQNLTGFQLINILHKGLGAISLNPDEILCEVGLEDKKFDKIRNYSRGMIQRLGIAISLLKAPEVLILDEPTLGLDPVGQIHMLNLLDKLNKEGKTVFFSSHILTQIEKICHRIGVVHKGELKFIGTLDEILKKYNTDSLEDAFLTAVNKGKKYID